MPELPEVETIVRKLREHVAGKSITDIRVLRGKSFQGSPEQIVGTTIVDVTRTAKIIVFQLDGEQNLLSHLKMTGQFIYTDEQTRVGGGHPTADWVAELPSAHTRVLFELSDNARLYFNDQRVFGWLKLVNKDEEVAELAGYAPDITSPHITADYFFEKLQKTKRAIKVVLLDNAIASGVGNIYACDALNKAQIDPRRSAASLSKEEAKLLLAAAKEVITLGIELGGATIDSYTNVAGFAGKYQEVRRVYGREGERCPNCGGVIHKFKLAGRGTYWCPQCQQ